MIIIGPYSPLAVRTGITFLTKIPKYFIDEKRPEFNGHNSFPSGHSATVFMGEELVWIEYGGWYAVGAYTHPYRRMELSALAKTLSEEKENMRQRRFYTGNGTFGWRILRFQYGLLLLMRPAIFRGLFIGGGTRHARTGQIGPIGEIGESGRGRGWGRARTRALTQQIGSLPCCDFIH